MPGKAPANWHPPLVMPTPKQAAKLAKGLKEQAQTPAASRRAEKRRLKKLRRQQMSGTAPVSKPAARSPQLLAGLVSPYPEMRMPTVDAPLTSTMTVTKGFSISNPNVSPYKDSTLTWNAGDLVCTLVGQPGLLAIVGPYYAPASATTGWFNAHFSSITGTSLSWPLVGPNGPLLQPWPLAKVTVQSAIQNYLFGLAVGQKPIGMSGGLPFIMLSGNEQLDIHSCTGTGGSAGGLLYFEIDVYTSQDAAPTTYTKQVATDANGNIPGLVTLVGPGMPTGISGPVHVCVRLGNATGGVASNLTITSLRVNNSAPGYMWAEIHTPELDQDLAIGQQCRRIATTMSLINTSAFTSRQGSIIAARVSAKPFGADSPSSLSIAAQRYRGDATKGVFTYMEFSSTAEKFKSAMNDYGGIIYDLDDDDFNHVIQVSNSNHSTAPNSFLANISIALEFKTESQRYSKAVSSVPHGALIEARRQANSHPWFYECNDPDGKDVSRLIVAQARSNPMNGQL